MNNNNFIFKLNNKLIENEFYGVEILKYYNVYDKHFLIHITAKRNNHKYVYDYSINEKYLDTNSIEKIVNDLLKGE